MLLKTDSHRSDHRFVRRIAIFGTLSVIAGGGFLLGLAQNGRGAVERYNELIAVDKAGGDVEASLTKLRTYIYSHMNSEIGGQNSIYPPIQLSGTYQRLVEAEEKRVAESNDNLYAEAQEYCEANGSQGFSGRNRLDCINAYIDEKGTKVRPIDESLYKFDFVAPRWSFDLAGVSLLMLILFASLTGVNLLMYLHTRSI